MGRHGHFYDPESRQADRQNRTQRNADRKGSLIGNTQAHLKEVADIPANLYYDLVGKHGTPQQNPNVVEALVE